jgi:hypothetical protein
MQAAVGADNITNIFLRDQIQIFKSDSAHDFKPHSGDGGVNLFNKLESKLNGFFAKAYGANASEIKALPENSLMDVMIMEDKKKFNTKYVSGNNMFKGDDGVTCHELDMKNYNKRYQDTYMGFKIVKPKIADLNYSSIQKLLEILRITTKPLILSNDVCYSGSKDDFQKWDSSGGQALYWAHYAASDYDPAGKTTPHTPAGFKMGLRNDEGPRKPGGHIQFIQEAYTDEYVPSMTLPEWDKEVTSYKIFNQNNKGDFDALPDAWPRMLGLNKPLYLISHAPEGKERDYKKRNSYLIIQNKVNDRNEYIYATKEMAAKNYHHGGTSMIETDKTTNMLLKHATQFGMYLPGRPGSWSDEVKFIAKFCGDKLQSVKCGEKTPFQLLKDNPFSKQQGGGLDWTLSNANSAMETVRRYITKAPGEDSFYIKGIYGFISYDRIAIVEAFHTLTPFILYEKTQPGQSEFIIYIRKDQMLNNDAGELLDTQYIKPELKSEDGAKAQPDSVKEPAEDEAAAEAAAEAKAAEAKADVETLETDILLASANFSKDNYPAKKKLSTVLNEFNQLLSKLSGLSKMKKLVKALNFDVNLFESIKKSIDKNELVVKCKMPTKKMMAGKKMYKKMFDEDRILTQYQQALKDEHKLGDTSCSKIISDAVGKLEVNIKNYFEDTALLFYRAEIRKIRKMMGKYKTMKEKSEIKKQPENNEQSGGKIKGMVWRNIKARKGNQRLVAKRETANKNLIDTARKKLKKTKRDSKHDIVVKAGQRIGVVLTEKDYDKWFELDDLIRKTFFILNARMNFSIGAENFYFQKELEFLEKELEFLENEKDKPNLFGIYEEMKAEEKEITSIVRIATDITKLKEGRRRDKSPDRNGDSRKRDRSRDRYDSHEEDGMEGRDSRWRNRSRVRYSRDEKEGMEEEIHHAIDLLTDERNQSVLNQMKLMGLTESERFNIRQRVNSLTESERFNIRQRVESQLALDKVQEAGSKYSPQKRFKYKFDNLNDEEYKDLYLLSSIYIRILNWMDIKWGAESPVPLTTKGAELEQEDEEMGEVNNDPPSSTYGLDSFLNMINPFSTYIAKNGVNPDDMDEDDVTKDDVTKDDVENLFIQIFDDGEASPKRQKMEGRGIKRNFEDIDKIDNMTDYDVEPDEKYNKHTLKINLIKYINNLNEAIPSLLPAVESHSSKGGNKPSHKTRRRLKKAKKHTRNKKRNKKSAKNNKKTRGKKVKKPKKTRVRKHNKNKK